MKRLTRRELIQSAALAGTMAFGVPDPSKVAGADAKRPETREQILLQIYFKVSKERAALFERMYAESYVPALRKQQGYLRSSLLRLFPQSVARGIKAAPTDFNYQIELVFDTEENRRKWVASKEHAKAWPLASGMAEKFAWRGFDIVGNDEKAEVQAGDA